VAGEGYFIPKVRRTGQEPASAKRSNAGSLVHVPRRSQSELKKEQTGDKKEVGPKAHKKSIADMAGKRTFARKVIRQPVRC